METVPLKVQESIFDQLLAKADNKVCADCPNKSPTWTSIDFGVFLCLRCAGVHRQLGPSISRVRSAKLDSWKMECIEMLAAVGNRIGNDYWENRVPSHFRKPDITTSMEDVRKMVNEKYIKKSYAPKDRQNPVLEFLEAKKTSQITAGAFSQAKLAEINGGSVSVSKPSVSMKVDTQKSTNATVVAPPQKQKDLLDFDDDEDENFGSFSSAPAEKLEISSPTKDMHQWNSNHETPTNIGSNSGSHLHHTKNPISHHPSNNMMNLFPADLDFTGAANNTHNSTNAHKSNFGFINNSSHQNPNNQQQPQQQNNTSVNSNQLYDLYKSPNTNQALLTQVANPAKNFSGGQSNYAFLEMMGGQNRGQQQQQQQHQQQQQQQQQQYQQQQFQQQQYQQQNNGFGMQNNTQQPGYGNSNNKQFSANGFGNGYGVSTQGGFSGGVNNTGGFGAPTQQGFSGQGFGGQGFGGQNAGFPSNHFGGNPTGMQQQGGFSMGSNTTPGYGGGMPVNNTTTNTSNNFMWEQPKSSSNTMNLF